MEITDELLGRFVKGQFEWQNPEEGWLYRGQIAGIQVEKNSRPADIWFNYKVTIQFEWVAELKKDRGVWVEIPDRSITFDTMLYSFNWLGASLHRPGERLGMVSQITGELGVFFPPGGSKLERESILPREDNDGSEAGPGVGQDDQITG